MKKESLDNMEKTNLGKYLYSERINRKGDNIKEYLANYKLPISESYYRDIESGRKVIRIDSANELCEALELSIEVFYYYLLKDLLQEDVFDKLVKKPLITDVMYNSPAEGVKAIQQELEMYRNAFTNRLIKKAYLADDKLVEYLSNNMEYLPLVHYIYMREKCTFSDINELKLRNKMNIEVDELIKIIDEKKIASVNYNDREIVRFGEEFECPQTPCGHKLKNKFLQYEISKTVIQGEEKNSYQNDIKIGKENGYVFAGITCIDLDETQEMFERNVSNMVACFNSAIQPLEKENSLPYFLSLVVAPRPEYDTKECVILENNKKKGGI